MLAIPQEALTFLILAVPLSLIAALMATRHEDRTFLLTAVFAGWLILVPLTTYVNEWSEFSGGGDDEGYYRLAETDIGGLEGIFDFSKFRLKMEQPGYPWVLHIVSAVTGHELLVYKFFNLFLLILLGIVWYRIGLRLEPESTYFAKGMIVIVYLLTPLWVYCFFSLKDLMIALIQSWAVLITIEMWLHFKPRHLVYFAIAGFFLILFRTALLVQSSLVLGISLGMLLIFRSGSNRLNSMIAWSGGLAMVVVMIFLSMNPAYMAALGIHSESRVVSSDTIVETGMAAAERSTLNRVYFPVLYLFTETSGFSPAQWQERDYQWLRGLTSIPWILFIVPFVIVGSFFLFQRQKTGPLDFGNQNDNIRFLATPWNTVLIFIASSMSISWIVGDTTRWRIPDLPALGAIAFLGWINRPKHRVLILVGWFIFVFLSATLFHLLRRNPG